jgi:hypothetical protein
VEILTKELGLDVQRVTVPVSVELTLTMLDVIEHNPKLAGGPPQDEQEALAVLNRQVIEHEAKIQYISLSQRNRYHKYIINGDRIRVFPTARAELQPKSNVKLSFSNYFNSHPNPNHRQSYLKDVIGINTE